ncbi:cell envelope integrity protein CreD [Hydrogenophaga sp. MI9]|uniref:cell envelope integrity protein CreD n=1 Tax=Hydrogenophaga sp. MI9 TaxID=3453719 RepID=UPI003EEE5170
MNRFPLLSKTAIIGFLMVLLLIPLSMVREVIAERTQNREQATREVARAHAGEQTLTGPVLQVPYTETYIRTVIVDVARNTQREETVRENHVATVFPTMLDMHSRLTTETRWRGIFPVTVYNSRHDSAGRFVWKGLMPREKGGQITLGQPWLSFGVSDLRGLLGRPELKLGGHALAIAASPAGANLPLPLAAPLDAALLQPGATLDFTLGMDLAGTERIGFVPLADDNKVTLTSPWPHPSFDGDFLPRSRSVTAQGFEASWSVPSLSTQAQQQFLSDAKERPPVDSFSVSLEDPVDVYRLTERATKYGLMFIVLTFAAFFVLEMVRRWRIHPMQYLMIGAALVLFFLLLLSLSEHLDFRLAYLVASAGCIALLAHYLRHVLGGWRAGLGMGGMLVALYGVLYGILISEDNALMMGSLLLFGVLAAIMVATRKIDWYNVMGSGTAAADPAVSASRA